MRFKMIGLAGVSLLLLAGCDGKSPLAQADNSCVQKPVCATPAQPAPPATTPPPSYSPPAYAPPRARRAVRYGSRRWSGGSSYRYRSTSRYVGSDGYDAETRDYGQIYSAGDTRYAGTRVQVQTSDSYTQSSDASTSYSSYGGGYAGGYSYGGGGGTVVVSGGPGGCPGACGPGRPRVAGRDRQGYLTWPSK